jgi:RNA polymerase sigma-70 factor (ECF subfamily)
VIWVEPFPDEYIDGQPSIYPEARYEVRESITLAFVAALQKLPGRQRAALLLCDVLGWSANEAAEILDTSTAAVNSALQRARETRKQPERKTTTTRLDEQLSALLARYVTAWEDADSVALVAVLREDVVLTMPPLPVWFGDRVDVWEFIQHKLFQVFDPFQVRLIPVRANGSPAFAVYQMHQDGIYHAAALHILTIEDESISEINDFLAFDGQLFSQFGLPLMI